MGENKTIKEAFDRESFIIDFLSQYDEEDILFIPDGHKTRRLLKNITKSDLWHDNSGNTLNPPDFISDTLHLLLEVMQVDEYVSEKQIGKKTKRINTRKQKEAEYLRRLAEKGILDSNETPIIALPDGEDLIGLEHNYQQYLQDFQSVVGKHNKRIEAYKTKRQSYKTVFLVFDTSSQYVETYQLQAKETRKAGNIFHARNFHYWFMDKAFIDFISTLNCDYLIWATPFKEGVDIIYTDAPSLRLPKICIFKISECKNIQTKFYDPELTISTEDNSAPNDKNNK